MTFTLPELEYDYSALGPYIDSETMKTHHTKHHAGYVAKLNAAVEGTDLEKKSLIELLSSLSTLPKDKQAAIRNNGGGHANHSLFWSSMSSNPKKSPEGELKDAIDKKFGGVDAFKTAFSTAAVTQFGSGWAWLCVKADKSLCVCSTANQDNPLMEGVGCDGHPILGIDVWEHAYYLNYQNRRPDYVNAFFNVVDWSKVEENFIRARG